MCSPRFRECLLDQLRCVRNPETVLQECNDGSNSTIAQSFDTIHDGRHSADVARSTYMVEAPLTFVIGIGVSRQFHVVVPLAIPNVLPIDVYLSIWPFLRALSCLTWIAMLGAALSGRPVLRDATWLPRFQMKHLLILILFSAIGVAYVVTLTTSHELKRYFQNLRAVPRIVIWSIGFMAALACYRRQPISASMVLIVVSSLLFLAAMDPILREWRSYSANSYLQHIRWARSVGWFGATIISPAAYLFVIGAIFTERSQPVESDKTVEFVPCEIVTQGSLGTIEQ